MKKMILGLCALVACFVFASCGSNPTSTLKDLTKQIQDADEISTDEWNDIKEKALNAQIDFYSDLERSDEDIKEFDKAMEDYRDARNKYSEKVDKQRNEELKKLDEKLDDVKKKFNEKQNEKNKDKKDKD